MDEWPPATWRRESPIADDRLPAVAVPQCGMDCHAFVTAAGWLQQGCNATRPMLNATHGATFAAAYRSLRRPLMATRTTTLRRIATFLVIVAGLSAILDALLVNAGTIDAAGGLYAFITIWVPAIAALVTCRIHREPIRSLGWHPGKPRYLALAYLLPVAYATVAYGVAWIIGAGRFTGIWPAHLPIFLVVGTIGGVISALGEEVGWRGYLVPHLASAYGFTVAALASGLIWSLWHYPLLLFTDYGEGGPRWYLALCFTLFAVGLSFPMAWLRLRSGSVWPAVLLHASHNLFVLNVFAPLMAEKRTSYLLTGEGGLLLAIAGVILGGLFWALRPRAAESPDAGARTDERGHGDGIAQRLADSSRTPQPSPLRRGGAARIILR
jgi:membrane protease YdiL (CAAX protease family)